MTIALAVLIGLFLAYANGSNDNYKGVATLYSSGALTYRKALYLATAAQVSGSLAALYLAQGLIAKFSGKGLVPDEVVAMKSFGLSAGLAAAMTVALANRVGLPISTTHALIGALVGAGTLSSATGVNYGQLGASFFAPLLLSPLAAAVLAAGTYGMARVVGGGAEHLPGSRGRALIDFFHALSGAVVCFARALNDTPKLAATLLIGTSLSPDLAMAGVAAAMAAGGLLNSRKIAETMGHKITTLNHSQGLSANLVTGFLVTCASRWGLPVSTTHVSVGSLFGIATVNRKAELKTISHILLAWVTTLPIAASFGAAVFLVLSRLNL